ncbi:MAG: CBS domain-containing protein [Cyanobacteria bacterium J06560_2]
MASKKNEDFELDAIAQILMNQSVQSSMSAPVRTLLVSAKLTDAQEILHQSGHTVLCVINGENKLVGMLSRWDVDVALRHGLADSHVRTCMVWPVRAISPQNTLFEAHALMKTYGIGRLPVVSSSGDLAGIITRSDLLRRMPVPMQSSVSQLPIEPLVDSAAVPDAAALYQQLAQRSGPIWPLLTSIAEVAEEKGWAIYAVGGAVRDLLLSHMGYPYPLTDIDLVVDGVEAEAGAGVLLAQSIQDKYPQVALKVFGEFQTAELTWPVSAQNADGKSTPKTLSALSIDIATARTEFYPYSAANPVVASSTIHQDLYRRDFTINAMALRLNGDGRGQLLDFFGGWLALQQRHVRVIHPNSFIEDPTRIFRAVRFAVRLGFALDDYTEQLVYCAVGSGIYSRLQATGQKVPALQSRLLAELQKNLISPLWQQALMRLNQLGAFACLHPEMSIAPDLWQQLGRMVRWQPKFLPDYPCWRLLLVLLIAQLPSEQRKGVAIALNLDAQSQHQLANLHQWESALLVQLPTADRPSQIYECLHSRSLTEQLLIVARHPYTLGPQIWHYIVHLSRMPPLINGGTLKRLGYPPGPAYREILAAVHQLTLDGELNTSEAAVAYVLANYPIASNGL